MFLLFISGKQVYCCNLTNDRRLYDGLILQSYNQIKKCMVKRNFYICIWHLMLRCTRFAGKYAMIEVSRTQ